MRNVLIITTGFPPINNISARRFGGMVEYMEEFGWRPWIVTLKSEGTLPVNIPHERIIHVGSASQVGNRVAEVEFNSFPKSFFLLRNALGKVGLHLRSIDRTLLGWYKDVKVRANHIDRLGKMDMVVGSYGPSAALWLARFFGARYHAPWIADFRDTGAIRDDERPFAVRYMDMVIEAYMLHSSVGITTVGNELAKMLQARYNKSTKAIYNGHWFTHTTEANSTADYKRSSNPARYVYYAGQVYEHQLNALGVFFQYLQEVVDVQLLIRFTGSDTMRSKIVALATSFGVQDKVNIWPACPPEIVIREAQMSVCNLVVEELDTKQQWSKGTITGKLLELLPLDPPVLAIGRPDSEIGSILEKTYKGKLCSSVTGVHFFLSSLGNSKYAGIPAEISWYSKRSQCNIWCAFLNQMVEKARNIN